MEKFISLKELIKYSKKEGVDLGKGDPYNRLRYYTKMGWLPHMTRKINDKGDIEGHYPSWAMDTLIKIQELKNEGMPNDQIDQKIKLQINLKKTSTIFSDKENQKKALTYGALIVLAIIMVTQFTISSKNKQNNWTIDAVNTSPNYIVESGTGLILKNTNTITIKTNNAKLTNRINITFKDDYAPANRYWVTYSQDQTEFTLRTDVPVAEDSGFHWFISN